MDNHSLEVLNRILHIIIKEEALIEKIYESVITLSNIDNYREGVADVSDKISIRSNLNYRADFIYKSMDLNRSSQVNLDAVADNIGKYLVHYNTDLPREISKSISKIELESFFNLKKKNYKKLALGIFEHLRKYNDVDEFYNVGPLKSFFFSSIVHVLYTELGIEKTFILMEEFMNLFNTDHFANEQRCAAEVLIKAAEYCKQNSEYPIEWSLAQAFNSDSKIEASL